MLGSLCVVAVAAIAYVVCGYAWESYAGMPQHSLMLGGKSWGWIAASPFFLRGLPMDGSRAPLAALLQIFGVGLAALIPWGAGSDRWRLRAGCASTAVFAAFTYPLFAHWVWGGGWLAQLGANYGLGRGFMDTAGAGTMQATGGLTALCIVWLAGARQGKYSVNQLPAVFPGHNILYVIFGGLLALSGWLGLNGAGAMLFAGIAPAGLALVAINTVLCASATLLTTLTVTSYRFGKPDASLCANGWMAGLVASSAICAFVTPIEALLTGVMMGVAVPFLAEQLELHCGVDDPTGAVTVHACGGLWGLLAVGFMGRMGVAAGGQMLAQIAGVATLVGFVLPLTYGLNWLLGRIVPYRVGPEGERVGMDMHELGAGAYPEFVTHAEDFIQR
jgi:Amt family ammonium transporter